MKKIKFIATAILIVLLISRKALAAGNYASGMTEEQTQIFLSDLASRGFNMSNFNINGGNLQTVLAMWVNGGKIYGYQRTNGYVYFYAGDMTFTENGFIITQNNAAKVCYKYYTVNQWDGGIYQSPTTQENAASQAVAIFSSESFNDYFTVIDYDNYTYDPSIYVPNIKAVYSGSNPSQTASSYSIPVTFTIDNGTGVEYGIQVKYKLWMPTIVKFNYSDGGAVTYNYSNYTSAIGTLFEMGDDTVISAAENGINANYSFNLSSKLNEWQNFHDVVIQDQTYQSNVSDYSSSQNSYLRFNKNALKMGNRLEIWVRYYYVDDGIAYAGDWRHWLSEAPQEQDLVSSVQYVNGSNVAADSNQINPSDQEISEELEAPVSVLPSYQNVQVTVINQVPNNMNYPTISAYQNDNMLVDTMNNATKIMNWLNGEGEFEQAGMTGASNGGFGAFLGASFGFIPWYIWAVIAVGFGFSIVIMILKVL